MLEALDIFTQGGALPSRDRLYHLLQDCGRSSTNLAGCRKLHYLLIFCGLQSVAPLANHVIRFFTDIGSLFEASLAFCNVSQPCVYTWHALLSAHSQLGQRASVFQIYCQLHDAGVQPDKVMLLCALQNCYLPLQRMLLHTEIVIYGLESDSTLSNTLIDTYMKCGEVENARMIFDKLRNRDLVSWTVMIAGYAEHGENLVALELYDAMQKEEIEADRVTCSTILKVCGNLQDLEAGRLIYQQFLQKGHQVDMVFGNVLLEMYGKCGNIKDAEKVFDTLSSHDAMSWSLMITMYVEQGQSVTGVELYGKMLEEAISLDRITLLCSLRACANADMIEEGRLLHLQVVENRLEDDVVLGNTIIDMHAKCGNIEDAERAFSKLRKKDLISWNTIITAYSQHEQHTMVLVLFNTMQQLDVNHDKVTLLCTLKACIGVGGLWEGKLIHDKILRGGLDSDLVVGNALLDMYARWGQLTETKSVFDSLPKKDAGSWGTMSVAYTEHGDYKRAVENLRAMCKLQLKPLARTFTSILTACSHEGLVEEGAGFFMSMVDDYELTPNDEHLNCIIDLLGRAGSLSMAEVLAQTMPCPPNITVLTSLLAACQIYRDAKFARQCFNHAVCLRPSGASSYVLMSSMYVECHDEPRELLEIAEMRQHGCAWKRPGKAWIRIKNQFLEFTKSDQLQAESTTHVLARLGCCLNHHEYIPMVDLV